MRKKDGMGAPRAMPGRVKWGSKTKRIGDVNKWIGEILRGAVYDLTRKHQINSTMKESGTMEGASTLWVQRAYPKLWKLNSRTLLNSRKI